MNTTEAFYNTFPYLLVSPDRTCCVVLTDYIYFGLIICNFNLTINQTGQEGKICGPSPNISVRLEDTKYIHMACKIARI